MKYEPPFADRPLGFPGKVRHLLDEFRISLNYLIIHSGEEHDARSDTSLVVTPQGEIVHAAPHHTRRVA